MIYPVKIVGVVVDVHNITMYKADGDTLIIPQGDPRVRDLVAKLVPAFDNGGPQFYMLQAEDMQDRNHFADAEKKMGGVVRFFKMVKSKAKELLEKFVEPVEPMVLGTKEAIKPPPVPVHMVNGEVVEEAFPMAEEAKPQLPPEEERPLTKSAAAVAEIMANAVPSTNPNFSVPDVTGEEETTVIAVLEDDTVIPGCEVLAVQAQAVSEGVGSGIGMQNFLRRAGMIRRGHSVEDLLKFIQKGELPLADDGCVLVYKLLNKLPKEEGTFVDCHSGNVKQRVGSFVHMKESLVDPNRAQDCSNGLHVARRDYLRNFHGDVCVLAKLAPEDVIAVPQYDARKLRAKGYHIIAELTAADTQRVKQNRPMQDQVLLGNAIAGNHVGILEYVEITQSKGGGLIITPVEGVEEGSPALDHNLTGSSLDHLPNPETNPEGLKVDARELALDLAKPVPAGETEQVRKVVDEANERYQAPPAGMNVKSEPVGEATSVPAPVAEPKAKLTVLQSLLADWTKAEVGEEQLAAARALLHFKKQSKKSWTALGVDIKVWEKATQLVQEADTTPPAPVIPAAAKPKATVKVTTKGNTTVVKATAGKGIDLRDVIGMPVPAVKKAAPTKSQPKVKAMATPTGTVKRSQKEEAAHLLDIYTKNPDYTNCKQLVAFKRAAKKGWGALGIPEAVGKKAEARVKL